MDSLPAILILVPILSPLMETLGIHPIHFGVLVTFNLVIGLITPPYGAALFTGSIVSGLPIEKLVREMLPFILRGIYSTRYLQLNPSMKMKALGF